jgi:prepilin-type processing-associated H-X9-DG protein
VSRHSGGIIIGYADGHSAFISKKYDENDKENEVNKAFYRAVELGYIKKAGTKGR